MGHLDWGLGTLGLHSDPADKTFLGLHIVSNVSKWPILLLNMGWKLLQLAPVLIALDCDAPDMSDEQLKLVLKPKFYCSYYNMDMQWVFA